MIRTYTGLMVDPFDMRPEDINITDIAHALSMTCRYGGHSSSFYSVAEHSVLVSFALPRELALWGLLHDAAEAYLGDVPSPIKRLLPAFSDTEDDLLDVIAWRFGLLPEIPQAVHDVDRAILADEMDQLMGGYVAHNEPLGVNVHCWSPDMAKRAFLAAYTDLTTE